MFHIAFISLPPLKLALAPSELLITTPCLPLLLWQSEARPFTPPRSYHPPFPTSQILSSLVSNILSASSHSYQCLIPYAQDTLSVLYISQQPVTQTLLCCFCMAVPMKWLLQPWLTYSRCFHSPTVDEDPVMGTYPPKHFHCRPANQQVLRRRR